MSPATRSAPCDATRAAVLREAESWIGTPYRHQTSLKGVGCDCLGLLRGVWRALHGEEPEVPPPYAADWAEAMGAETLLAAATRHLLPLPLDEAQAGDVLLFRWRAHLPFKHCAILAPGDALIHAHEGACVTQAPWRGVWRRHAGAAFAFPPFPKTEDFP
jgi:NlpC/P60 family putative phage cell wall peptidase